MELNIILPGDKMKGKRIQIGTLLNEEIYRKAKAQAVLEGIKVGELIDKAILSYIKQVKENERDKQ